MVHNIENDNQQNPISEADLNNTKNKILQVVSYLVAEHIKDKGTFYESFGESSSGKGIVRISKKSPKYIASTIAPYVVWVAATYFKKIYGEELNILKFSKKADTYIPGAYKLNFSVLPNRQSLHTFFTLFLVPAFDDNFRSNEGNKIIINRLSNLISDVGNVIDSEKEENGANP